MLSSKEFKVKKGTEVTDGACPLLIGKSFLLFGGRQSKKQISLGMTQFNAGIETLGSLDFDFSYGTCLYYEGVVYLCFALNKERECHRR